MKYLIMLAMVISTITAKQVKKKDIEVSGKVEVIWEFSDDYCSPREQLIYNYAKVGVRSIDFDEELGVQVVKACVKKIDKI